MTNHSGESNSEWGLLAGFDTGMAEVWDRFERLPDEGSHPALDAFCAAKQITIPALLRLGARLTESGGTVLAFAYDGGIKYRDVLTGRRWSYVGSEWQALKIVHAAETATHVIVAEGETDGARLTLLYPEADVAVLPAGAKHFPEAYAAQLRDYVVVCVGLDDDDAGNTGAAKVSEAVAQAVRFAPPANDWCESDAADCPPLPDPSAVQTQPSLMLRRFPLGERMRAGIPEVGYLVPGLAYDRGVHWLTGPPKQGKSWLGRYLAFEAFKATQRPVVWIDHEAGWLQTAQALEDMGISADEADAALVYVELPSLGGAEPDRLRSELRAVIEHHDACALVIDSAGKQLAAMRLDENEAAAVTRWTAETLIPVTKELGIATFVIDHTAKSDGGRSGYARGSGEKLAASEVAWTVTADEFSVDRSGTITLRHSGNDRNGRLPSVVQFRAGGQGELSRFQLERVAVIDDGPPAAKVDDLVNATFVLVRERGPMQRKDIAAALEVENNGTFGDALKRGVRTKQLINQRRGEYQAAPEEPAI